MGHQGQHTTATTMSAAAADDTDALLAAQRELWCHALGYVKAMALKCAIDLRIPDAVHRRGGAGATLADLLAAADIPPSNLPYLRRLMRTLAAMGVFSLTRRDPDHDDDDDDDAALTYHLTPASRLLLTPSTAGDSSDHLSILPNIASHVDPAHISMMFAMPEWIRDPQAPAMSLFERARRQDMWASVKDDAANRASFYDSMEADTRLVMRAVLGGRAAAAFRGVATLVDVGGGRGTAAAAISGAFPDMECTVMDLPHVVAEAPGDAAGGLRFVAGDMFEHIPPADALLLKWILHDWDDAKCIKILERCKEAISGNQGKKGKVIIIDTVIGPRPNDDDTASKETYLLDLHIMSFVNGVEREEHEWRRIFRAAGFSDYKITHTPCVPSVIEVYP